MMETMNKFTIKDYTIVVKYYDEDKDIEMVISSEDGNYEIYEFENRKDFFYFINQLTDAAEEIKDLEE